MFNRTTSFLFGKYGEVFKTMPEPESSFMRNARISNVRLRDKQIHYYMNYDRPVYIRAISGIIMLIVATKEDPQHYERFIIHRVVKLRPDTMFNLISVSQSARYEICYLNSSKYEEISLPQGLPIVYERLVPKIRIQEILCCYYQVRNSDYFFPGEAHNYFELTLST